MPRFPSPLYIGITLTLALVACVAAGAAAQDTARPVDTLQFGLLQLGWSQADVERRIGPPTRVETETRSVVPVRDRQG